MHRDLVTLENVRNVSGVFSFDFMFVFAVFAFPLLLVLFVVLFFNSHASL